MKQTKKDLLRNRRSGGFTLTEILVAVAILVILMGIGLSGLTALRRNLRQKELDSKAEIIYMAAQYRLSELKAAGYSSVYAYDPVGNANGVQELGYVPSDAIVEDENGEEEVARELCYVRSADVQTQGMAARFLLPQSAVDVDLWGNQWIIEYSPKSGMVYSVFYSEGAIDMDRLDMEAMDNYRTKSTRLNRGAKIGYYGGDLTLTEGTSNLIPRIEIINQEKLIARFYCNNPETDKSLTFHIMVSDGTKQYTRDVTPTRIGARTYRYEWVMDSLESEKTGFAAQTGLEAGTTITVSMTASSGSSLVDDAEAQPVKTNSLFGYQEDVPSNTALISYGRHLQNLDRATSKVTEKITAAVQIRDISFADDPTDDEDFYSFYGPYFKPIENSALQIYDGEKSAVGTGAISGASTIHGLRVRTRQGTSGLFATFRGEEIRNVNLTGTRLEGGTSVGALAGTVNGTVKITNCRVYLSAARGDITGQEADEPGEVSYRINGTTAGGLVGAVPRGASLTIEDSFAATTVAGSRYAGGLVGSANAAVTVRRAYADCYLKSQTTGGLVGVASPYSSVNLEDVYAVGYQLASKQAAGLVAGNVGTAKRGYAAVDFTKTDDNAKIYTTAVKGNAVEQLYYVSGGDLDQNNIHMDGSVSLSYAELTDSSFGGLKNGDGETATFVYAGGSNPYNLMGQGLSNYAYPRLEGLSHYGDWQAQFESGMLVYYEYYGNGRYGFYGGNKTTLQDRPVLGDGYALAYMSSQDVLPTVTYADGVTEPFHMGHFTVTEGQNNFYLYPLSPEKTNDDTLVKTGEFYQQLTVKDAAGETRTFYYNPNFAETAVTSAKLTDAPGVVLLRSPRQLYALSRLYGQYDAAVRESLFRQEMNLDYGSYHWGTFYLGADISVQSPIGSGETPFAARYDGRYHSVSGVSVQAEAKYVGFFGVIGSGGSVQNLVLNGENQSVAYRRADGYASVEGAGNSADVGALAGSNQGYIGNCAVYGLTGEIYGYDGAVVRVGGLVGSNYGTVAACSVDTRSLEMGSSFARLFGGGFAGLNRGTISESYSVGLLNFKDFRESTVTIAGFAADNSGGNLIRCYSGIALSASGEVGVYGFAPVGGYTSSCYYLDKGTYAYNDQLYSFNVSANQYAPNSVGAALDATELEQRSTTLQGFGEAKRTVGKDPKLKTNYPYPAAVKDANGNYIHYGYWPNQEKNIGTVGVFYWEHETGGSSGYHISYVGTVKGEAIQGDPLKGASLCRNHDDGGYIDSYGYGYFYSVDIEQSGLGLPQLVPDSGCVLGEQNEAAGEELHRQMPKYRFVAYTTGSQGLHLTENAQNATWTLYYPYVTDRYGRVDGTKSGVYVYTVCPFFGNSMSLNTVSPADETGETSVPGSNPGMEANPYEIRSVDQLQNINWNYRTNNATHIITGGTWSDYQSGLVDVYVSYSWYGSGTIYASDNCIAYPYLVCSRGNDKLNKVSGLKWQQSHNIDAALEKADSEFFTPIGSMYDTAALNTNNSYPVMAYFASSFDGDDYAIKNLQVKASTQMVGVFGITVGADMRDVVLYADALDAAGQKRAIQNTVEGTNWYSIGGLVGFAAKGSTGSAAFTNCTVSGYQIIDNRAKGVRYNYDSYSPGWGGACIGGLVGTTNMDITGCTAVTDIKLRFGYQIGWMNVRVGGIAGCSRGVFDSCYAGGSIQDETGLPGSGSNGTEIWAAGIVGGLVVRNGGDLRNLVGNVDGQVFVRNCYSYVEMPYSVGVVASSQSIGSNGEMQSEDFGINRDGYEIDYPYITIQNSYALDSAVKNTDDYRNYSAWADDAWGNLNVNRKSNDSRRGIYFENGVKPYLTYETMRSSGEDSLISYLNSSYFGWVTVEENGASVSGKYSYPGSDRQLKGHNYPFPTVLHQKSIYSDVANNVHYGEWPKLGIYWEENTLTMDMLASRTADVKALDVEALLAQAQIDDQAEQTQQLPAEQENPPISSDEPASEAVIQKNPDQTALAENEIQEKSAETLDGKPEENSAEKSEERSDQAPEEKASAASEESSGEPALLSLDSLEALSSYKLYVVGLDAQYVTSKPSYLFMDENKEEYAAPETDAPAYVVDTSDLQSDGVEHFFDVTFRANHPGVMLVEATLQCDGKEYVAQLTLTVTAELKINIHPESIETYEGDKSNYIVTLSDAMGNAYAPAEGAKLKWSMSYPNQAAKVVAWEEDEQGNLVMRQNKDGSFTLTLEGILSGEGSVTIGLSYAWNKDVTIESNLNIRAVTKPSDVLGIGDGTVFQQIKIPHTIRKDDTSFTGTDLAQFPGTVPSLDTVYLYATKDYTNLADFQVKSVEFKVGAGDYGEDESLEAQVSETVTDSNGYACRAITVTGEQERQWSLRVTLEREGVTYVLVYSRPNQVHFVDTLGQSLRSFTVPQGQGLDLDGDDLSKKLSAEMEEQPKTGYRWVWEIPAAEQITGNLSIAPQERPIHYFVSYDGNYDGWEWNEDERDAMADSEFVYLSEGNVLRTNAFTRPGYAFLGWSTTPGGEVVYWDGDSLADFTGITVHGAYMTLYAKWVSGSYPVTFCANDGTQQTKDVSYTIGESDETLPDVQDLGFETEREFLGWAKDPNATAPLTDATFSQLLAEAHFGTVKLYAVWGEEIPAENDGPEGTDNDEIISAGLMESQNTAAAGVGETASDGGNDENGGGSGDEDHTEGEDAADTTAEEA